MVVVSEVVQWSEHLEDESTSQDQGPVDQRPSPDAVLPEESRRYLGPCSAVDQVEQEIRQEGHLRFSEVPEETGRHQQLGWFSTHQVR